MRVLNETYAPHDIQFVLRDVTHTVNDEWASTLYWEDNIDKSKALRRGSYGELNIYLESGLMQGDISTGICAMPVGNPSVDSGFGAPWSVLDGCHANPGTMPGGPGQDWNPNDNKGFLVTHEVGHWLGLFHPFEGQSCEGEGDFVDDTPAQALVTNGGCPIGKDSCPGYPGVDSIHNYMDYSDHDWYVTATPSHMMSQDMHSLTLTHVCLQLDGVHSRPGRPYACFV